MRKSMLFWPVLGMSIALAACGASSSEKDSDSRSRRKHAVTEAAAEETTAEETTAEETSAEETGAEESSAEETGAEETSAEETAAEETTAEETAAEETTAEETAAEETDEEESPYYFKDREVAAEDYTISIRNWEVIEAGDKGNKFGDGPVLAIWYEVTNTSGKDIDPASAWLEVFDAVQDTDPNIINKIPTGPMPDERFEETQMLTIKKDGTVENAVSYKLSDTETPVELTAKSSMFGEEIGSMTFDPVTGEWSNGASSGIGTVEEQGEIEPSFADNVLVTDDFTIEITDFQVIPAGEEGNEYGNRPVIAFLYDTTNTSGNEVDAYSSWIFCIDAIQDNDPDRINKLDIALTPFERYYDTMNKTIKAGATVENAVAYELSDTETPVELVASNSMFGDAIGGMTFDIVSGEVSNGSSAGIGTVESREEAEPSFADNVLVAEDYTIEILDFKVIPAGEKGNEYGENPVIAFWYNTTNTSGESIDPTTAWAFTMEALQDNDPDMLRNLDMAFFTDERFLDSQSSAIKAGGTVENAVAYELTDTETPVELTGRASSFGEVVGGMTFDIVTGEASNGVSAGIGTVEDTEKAEPSFEDNVLVTDEYTIEIYDYRVIPAGEDGNEYGLAPALAFWYRTTNTSGEKVEPYYAWLYVMTAVQDNDPNVVNELSINSPADPALAANGSAKIKAGKTVEYAVCYELTDEETPVELKASGSIFGDVIGSRVYEIK